MDKYEEFKYNQTKALKTNQVSKLQDCVVDTLYPLFYYYEQTHDNDNDHHKDDSAGLLGLMSIFLLI